jgi:hypothetical protein
MARGRQADSARHRQRVVAVLSKAGAGESEISVSGIARVVGVDRTFLYRYRDLLAQIHALEATPAAATVNEVLSGHVALDIECLDRLHLNAYVPILQSSGQLVAFMTQHLGLPIPSPALFEKISLRFRRAVASFTEANGILWGQVRQGRPQGRGDGPVPEAGGGHRPAAGRGDQGGAGVPASVGCLPARHPHSGAAVHLRQG